MENKKFESGEEALLILREIAERVGFNPETGNFENGK